jgi:hypothetical protein
LKYEVNTTILRSDTIYRLLAAHYDTFGGTVSNRAKKDFDGKKVKWWAKRIIDQSEFTSEKCKKGVSIDLLNVGLNADAPVNFRLTTLPGTLLDLGRDTNSLMAMQCEFNLSGSELRVSILTGDNPIVYILVSKSTRIVIDQLYADWDMMVQKLVPSRMEARIDRVMAGHWLYLIKSCASRLKPCYKRRASRDYLTRSRSCFKLCIGIC